MAIKGPAYVKTSWTFEERPVASSKLNTWDDRIEAALELICFLMQKIRGGRDGVLRGTGDTDLKVSALASPGLSVQAGSGYAFISGAPYKLAEPTETVDVTPPAAQDRIDLVQASLETWGVLIKTGTEAAAPDAPSPDTDCIALAELYLRPGMTSIKNSDDIANGYITDVRSFL
jgi:hypothetical protein